MTTRIATDSQRSGTWIGAISVGQGGPEQRGEGRVDEVGGRRAGAGRPAEDAAAPDRRLDDQDRDRPERDGDAETRGDPGDEGGSRSGSGQRTPAPNPARTDVDRRAGPSSVS